MQRCGRREGAARRALALQAVCGRAGDGRRCEGSKRRAGAGDAAILGGQGAARRMRWVASVQDATGGKCSGHDVHVVSGMLGTAHAQSE